MLVVNLQNDEDNDLQKLKDEITMLLSSDGYLSPPEIEKRQQEISQLVKEIDLKRQGLTKAEAINSKIIELRHNQGSIS